MTSLFYCSLILLLLSFIPPIFVKDGLPTYIFYLIKASLAGWITGGLFAFAFLNV